MGFIIHFYTIFGTNLLIGGPVQIVVFLPISVFRRKGISNESKRNETFGRVVFGTNAIQETWSGCQGSNEAATRQGGATPPLWAPRGSPDRLLSPIYTHIPLKHPRALRNPISTAATFCTREIPFWGLFQSSAGGVIDHGGLLHQHHSLSDDV